MSTPASPPPEPASKKKRGFTILWALGIVGVILFLLVAVATPKFGGFGQKCKSHQSEAKTNLSGLFTAEKAFFGEYTTYTTDLNVLNWKPDGSPAYAYGFATASEETAIAGIEGLDPTRKTTIDPRVVGTNAAYSVAKMKAPGGAAFSDEDFAVHAKGTTATKTTFRAAAIGNSDGDETWDVWTIDESKSLESLVNDCSS